MLSLMFYAKEDDLHWVGNTIAFIAQINSCKLPFMSLDFHIGDSMDFLLKTGAYAHIHNPFFGVVHSC